MDVNYSDQGARYALPRATFDPPVTATTTGKITIRVTNWGMTTWTPTNGYKLSYRVLNASGGTVQTGTSIAMPRNVAPHQSVDVPVTVAPIVGVGNYTLRVDMVNPSNASFNSTYGAPFGTVSFAIANGAPTIRGNAPPNNGTVDTLTPDLFANYYDPDNYPAGGERRATFRICHGTPEAPVGCQVSGTRNQVSWRVPVGFLKWGETVHWYVTVSDTASSSPEIGPIAFTTVVPQPGTAGRLSATPQDVLVPGLDPLAGNYSSTVTDANVAVVGPSLVSVLDVGYPGVLKVRRGWRVAGPPRVRRSSMPAIAAQRIMCSAVVGSVS